MELDNETLGDMSACMTDIMNGDYYEYASDDAVENSEYVTETLDEADGIEGEDEAEAAPEMDAYSEA